MIQMGSILKVTDNTGVVLVQCIKVLGFTKSRIAKIGQVILVSVRWINAKKFSLLKERKRKKFEKGTMHRALIIRAKFNYQRITGVFIKFDENNVIIVTKRVVPVSNRVYGPMLREFCMKWPSLGCICRYII